MSLSKYRSCDGDSSIIFSVYNEVQGELESLGYISQKSGEVCVCVFICVNEIVIQDTFKNHWNFICLSLFFFLAAPGALLNLSSPRRD